MSARHVLVARLDNLGDVLLAGPAVRAIAASAGRVTFLCGSAGRSAAELLPGVDQVVVHDAPWVSFSPPAVERTAIDALVDQLAALSIDEAFILTSFHQSPLPLALLLRMAGVGHLAAVSVDYPGSLLDVRHVVDDDLHEVERALSLVATSGYHLPAGDDGALAIRSRSSASSPTPSPTPSPFPNGAPYVVVHPGASVPARGWVPERAAALVDLLVGRGRQVVVTGGPNEVALAARVAGRPRPEVLDVAGTTDLAGLAAILDGAEAVVTGNTGPAHLAAAVGTPVVSIFAPVVPARRWRPWAVPVVLLGDQAIACAGCRARVCPFEGQPCTADVTPDAVVDAIETLLIEVAA